MTIDTRLTERMEGGSRQEHAGPPAVLVTDVHRRFRDVVALDGVSLRIGPGEIRALLGPNGAGKTTLLRILCGLVSPDAGHVQVCGRELTGFADRQLRRHIGLVPSGARSAYLRISGIENLVFFGRLNGLRYRVARERALEVLEDVGLADAAGRAVGEYSHGMQKRLAVGRALLLRPQVMYVDEATHDLDPEGGRRIRDLISDVARRGTAILWATQRLDEIRGFADRVTLLHRGAVRYDGSVAQLLTRYGARRYLLRLHGQPELLANAERALAGRASLKTREEFDPEHYLMWLHDDAILGEALTTITLAGVDVLACAEETSEIEEAFLALTEGGKR